MMSKENMNSNFNQLLGQIEILIIWATLIEEK